MNTPNYGRFWFRVCLAGILGLLLPVEINAQAPPPPGYRVQCSGGSCQLVRITAPVSVRRFQPLRNRDGRRFSTRSSVGMRPVQKALSRAGRLLRKGK